MIESHFYNGEKRDKVDINEIAEYLDCECGSKETYISFSKSLCCATCFRALHEKKVEVINKHACVFAADGGWAVKINGVVQKYFSKYEDYAFHEADCHARKLNRETNQVNRDITE